MLSSCYSYRVFPHLFYYFANNNFQYTKSVSLNKMNRHLYNSQVEEEVIQVQAPIINQNKNNNVSFSPYLEKSYSELS